MGLIDTYFQKAVKQNQIENELYRRYNVKKRSSKRRRYRCADRTHPHCGCRRLYLQG